MKRIVPIFFGFVAGFLVLEILSVTLAPLLGIHMAEGDRIKTFDEREESLYCFDEKLGWRLKSNYKTPELQTNSIGYRSSEEWTPQRLAGKEAVLLLGDSMVFGLNLDQKNIFSERLNSQNNRYYLFNTGVPMYSPWQEYLVLEEILKSFRPKKVIIFFFQTNDLLFSTRKEFFHPGVTITKTGLRSDPVRRRYLQPIYKRTFTGRLINQYFHGKDLHYLLNVIDLRVRGEWAYIWRVQRRIYEQIRGLSETSGFSVCVIDIPSRNEIFGNMHATKPHQLLAELCRQNGFDYFDLRKFYPSDPKELFFSNDDHWNDRGHAWVENFLKKNVLLQN